MSKIHEERFTLRFDPNDPIHFNAISILNDKKRNKANYIAGLIWDKEFNHDQNQHDMLKQMIKDVLVEVLQEHKLELGTTGVDYLSDSGDNNEIVLKKPTKDIASGFTKEVMQGLSAFGIKPNK